MPRKPADCTCGYPVVVDGNATGHDPDCPAYQRLATFLYEVQRESMTLRKRPTSAAADESETDAPAWMQESF